MLIGCRIALDCLECLAVQGSVSLYARGLAIRAVSSARTEDAAGVVWLSLTKLHDISPCGSTAYVQRRHSLAVGKFGRRAPPAEAGVPDESGKPRQGAAVAGAPESRL